MRRIDLHAHTQHSDGTLTPAELVRLARDEGLVALAVTDHDTVSGLPEAEAECRALGLELIPGCEISTVRDGRSLHMLAYGFDPAHAGLLALLERVQRDRIGRNDLMRAKLAELGMPLTAEEVARHATGRIVARPHFARAMVERGYVVDARDAFTRWLGDSCEGYVLVEMPTPVEAARAVRAAGGVSVLAHPRQVGYTEREDWDVLLGELREAGMGGLEVDHPSHKPRHRSLFRRLAEAHGLVASGGSDFHGANKPRIALGRGDGTIAVPYETWERLRSCRPAEGLH